METIFVDYAPKGVKFYYIYKALAHPEWDGYVTPYTLDERFLHVDEAKRTLGSGFSWLVDRMDNSVKHAMGRRPNSEFVIGPDGTVVRKRAWSNPDQLRKDLEELLGPVEKPTEVADLDLTTTEREPAAAKGVVKRLKIPRRMRPLIVKPIYSKNDEPYYAKLRVEAERGLLEDGEGRLYVRFMLDPLYDVHWNNLSPPLRVRLEAPQGLTLGEDRLTGPDIEEAESDIDPREFLVEAKWTPPNPEPDENGTADSAEESSNEARNADEDEQTGSTLGPIKLSVSYFACNDEAGWCKPLEQSYKVLLERDRDGGSAFRFGARRGRGQRQPREEPPQ